MWSLLPNNPLLSIWKYYKKEIQMVETSNLNKVSEGTIKQLKRYLSPAMQREKDLYVEYVEEHHGYKRSISISL